MGLRIAVLISILMLGGCGGGGGGGGGGATVPAPSTPPTPSPPAPATADLTVLMLGNSHTHANDLPGMLAAMLRAGRPGKTVAVVAAPGTLFLDQRLGDQESLNLFNSRTWSAVIFQAQQYSQSGQFEYSTEEAVEWVRRTRARQILPVLFPEWPRRGVNETERIYNLHVGIARRQAACVAPVPQAWDLAFQRLPGIVLHDADGNHSAPNGAFLAALVLYATLTGESPSGLPAIAALNVDAATQASLRAVAADQVRLTPPRQYCPTDLPI